MKTWKVTSAGRIAFGGLLVAGLCASTLMWSRYHQADPLLEPPPVGHNAVPAFEEAHAIAGECQAFLDNGTALPAHVRVSGLRFCELSNFCVPRLVPAVGSAPPGSRQPEGTDTKVTFFVRTYGGQMPKGSDVDVSFQDFVASLQRLADPAWEAVVFDTAVRYNPFTGLKEFVSGLKDPRVHVIQLPEAVLLDKWDLFGAGYPETDMAITMWKAELLRQGRRPSKWMVVTNGDNEYHPNFLSLVQHAEEHRADIVGCDFHSRWPYYNLRDIPLQCKTLEPAASFNTGYYGETDLGANLINFHKYIDAQLAFSDLPANNAQDGYMIAVMRIVYGWRYRRVPEALFSHTPNPHQCFERGGLWYDSPLRAELGCLEAADAWLHLSHDTHVRAGQTIGYTPAALKEKMAEATADEAKFVAGFHAANCAGRAGLRAALTRKGAPQRDLDRYIKEVYSVLLNGNLCSIKEPR